MIFSRLLTFDILQVMLDYSEVEHVLNLQNKLGEPERQFLPLTSFVNAVIEDFYEKKLHLFNH